MATKPTIALARFADGGSADKTAPSSGLRDTGFVAGTAIVQSFVNELLFQQYSWALYLSEGILSGNHSIAGTLATSEALTVGGQPLVVNDFVYTADSTTDTLTKTAHGLSTGDGALRTTNSGGGLPGGLAINTDYFAIVTGANTFKVATSRANALLGIAIDITSNGTGTQTMIDQPGTTRVSDAIVTRNLQVDGSATVTGDVIVSGRVKLPLLTRTILASVGMPLSGSTQSTLTAIGNAEVRTSGGAGTGWVIPFSVDPGLRLVNVRVRLKDNATGPTVIRTRVRKGNAHDTTSDITALTSSSGAGTYQTITFNSINNDATAGDYYEVFIDCTSGTNIYAIVKAEIDLLPTP